MIPSLPRLLAISCTTALLLSAWQQRGEVAPGRPASVAAAQRITLDPVTHQPVPAVAADSAQTAGDMAVAPTAPVATGPREATEVHLPDGTVGVRVDKRYFDTVTVCRQPDGSFSSACPAGKAVARP